MEVVKTVGDNTIIKKRSGRYGVQGKNKKWINGDEKAKILLDAGLIKVTLKQEAPAEEAPAEEVVEAAAEEAPAEEAPAEEAPAEEAPTEEVKE